MQISYKKITPFAPLFHVFKTMGLAEKFGLVINTPNPQNPTQQIHQPQFDQNNATNQFLNTQNKYM